MKKATFLFLISALLVFIAWKGLHKSQSPKESLFDTLQNETITKLTLVADLEELFQDKSSLSYQEAEVVFQKEDGSQVQYDTKVRLRGVSRREVCDFPPLKLKFEEEELKNHKLKTYQTLKLVTHCQEGDDYEQRLLKEYLTYKMYNSLTDNSFKVQLVQIQYVDSKSRLSTSVHYGFILENKDELADRLQARLMDKDQQSLKMIDANMYQLFTIFQYMIGNTDWNLSKQHNVKMLLPQQSIVPIPIPYDFDHSGLVDAPYAKPYPTMPINNVKDRYFQWRGKKDTDFSRIFDLFLAKKEEITSLCNGLDLLDNTVQTDMIQYLNSFYEIIETPRNAQILI